MLTLTFGISFSLAVTLLSINHFWFTSPRLGLHIIVHDMILTCISSQDIPAYHLARGSPARVIRRISSEDPVEPDDLSSDDLPNFNSVSGAGALRTKSRTSCSLGLQNWTMPEWVDFITYRRAVRFGGHDFVAMELIVAALVIGMIAEAGVIWWLTKTVLEMRSMLLH
jgi:hypothetical protein